MEYRESAMDEAIAFSDRGFAIRTVLGLFPSTTRESRFIMTQVAPRSLEGFKMEHVQNIPGDLNPSPRRHHLLPRYMLFATSLHTFRRAHY